MGALQVQAIRSIPAPVHALTPESVVGSDASVHITHSKASSWSLESLGDQLWPSSAGVVALPAGAAFPGVPAAGKVAAKPGAAARRPIFFVTAGERGTLRIWR